MCPRLQEGTLPSSPGRAAPWGELGELEGCRHVDPERHLRMEARQSGLGASIIDEFKIADFLRVGGYFGSSWKVQSSILGSLRQQELEERVGHMIPIVRMQRAMNAGAWLDLSFVFKSRNPALELVPTTMKVRLPSSVNLITVIHHRGWRDGWKLLFLQRTWALFSAPT